MAKTGSLIVRESGFFGVRENGAFAMFGTDDADCGCCPECPNPANFDDPFDNQQPEWYIAGVPPGDPALYYDWVGGNLIKKDPPDLPMIRDVGWFKKNAGVDPGRQESEAEAVLFYDGSVQGGNASGFLRYGFPTGIAWFYTKGTDTWRYQIFTSIPPDIPADGDVLKINLVYDESVAPPLLVGRFYINGVLRHTENSATNPIADLCATPVTLLINQQLQADYGKVGYKSCKATKL